MTSRTFLLGSWKQLSNKKGFVSFRLRTPGGGALQLLANFRQIGR
jgi:hypothetical protein